MFRRDILFTVVTVGILAAISATIHNLYTKLTEEEDSRDFLAPLRTIVKLGKLGYERSLPAWYQFVLLIKSQPRLLEIYEAARASMISERTDTAEITETTETTETAETTETTESNTEASTEADVTPTETVAEVSEEETAPTVATETEPVTITPVTDLKVD
jgi:hypothetical protein